MRTGHFTIKAMEILTRISFSQSGGLRKQESGNKRPDRYTPTQEMIKEGQSMTQIAPHIIQRNLKTKTVIALPNYSVFRNWMRTESRRCEFVRARERRSCGNESIFLQTTGTTVPWQKYGERPGRRSAIIILHRKSRLTIGLLHDRGSRINFLRSMRASQQER